jgi:hypothetical protein
VEVRLGTNSALKRARSPIGFVVLTLVALQTLATSLVAQSEPLVSHAVSIPRVDAQVEIDGLLDEPVWQSAAVLRGFTQYLPVDGRPAHDSTEVLAWYAPTALHFGVRCYDSNASVRATLAERDKIEGDDYVQILLDTFNDRRQAFVIGVNPLGVQSDGILRDADRRAGSGFSAGGSGAYTIDLSPDFVYQSKGRLTGSGYEIEIRIPFKSLPYQADPEQDWGLNVIRKVQHSGFEDTWSPVLQANASFLSQSGALTGLAELRRGLVLDLNPETTARVTGEEATSGWAYSGPDPELGGNLRWGVTNNLTLSGTMNPDFSQIEADVARVQFDPRSAVFFPEKRPFFLEGIEHFELPERLIYTRRIAAPIAAVKLTGKVSGTNVALLSGVDDQTSSATGSDNPVHNWLRVRRDLGGQSHLGIAYTDKVDGADYNRVPSVDGRWVFGGLYSVTFQGATSFTRSGGTVTNAPLWNLAFSRSGRTFGFTSSFRGVHPEFSAQGGFINRSDVVNASFVPRVTLFGRAGALLESWTGSVSMSGAWDYDRFMAGNIPDDPKLHLNGAFGLRGGWQVGTTLVIESFKYPPQLYSDYVIERTTSAGVDTIPYTGTDRLYNLDFLGSLTTPRFQNLSGNFRVIYGRDENFYEWAPANVFFLTVDINWRPTEQLRVNALYNHQQYIRPSDWSTVGMRRIPRLKLEYQLSRSIFVRFVGQYDAEVQDSLRDDSRTNDPILIYDSETDTYARAGREVRNDLRVDWLFSYRPTPGTVFFLGYGSSLEEPAAFRFRRIGRVNDGFFLKLSYLFRV